MVPWLEFGAYVSSDKNSLGGFMDNKTEELVKIHNQLMSMNASGNGLLLLADSILRLRKVIEEIKTENEAFENNVSPENTDN